MDSFPRQTLEIAPDGEVSVDVSASGRIEAGGSGRGRRTRRGGGNGSGPLDRVNDRTLRGKIESPVTLSYAGELTYFEADGDVRVRKNGERVDTADVLPSAMPGSVTVSGSGQSFAVETSDRAEVVEGDATASGGTVSGTATERGTEARYDGNLVSVSQGEATATISVEDKRVVCSAPSDSSVEFDAGGSYDDLSVAEYRWDFDGDGAVDRVTTEPTAVWSYEAAGAVTPRVTVVDPDGNTASTTLGVAVAASLPARVHETPADVRVDVRDAVASGRVETAGRSNGDRVVASGSLSIATGDTNGRVGAGPNSTFVASGVRVNGPAVGHNLLGRDARFNGGIDANGTVVATAGRTVVNGDLTAERVVVLSGATLRVTETLAADQVFVARNATLSVVQEVNASRVIRNGTAATNASDAGSVDTAPATGIADGGAPGSHAPVVGQRPSVGRYVSSSRVARSNTTLQPSSRSVRSRHVAAQSV